MANASLKPITVNSCPACGSMMIEELIEGQIVCRECGLVIGLGAKGDKNRTRKVPKLYQESGDHPVTFLKDYFPEWRRLLKVSDSTQSNVALTLYYITEIVRVLKLPRPVLDKSVELYEALAVKQNFKGKRLKAISAAIVYASCKILGVPCSIREFAKISDEDPRKIFHNYSFIAKSLEISQIKDRIDESLDRICKIMKIDALTRDIARKIMEIVRKIRATAGKNPHGYLAAAIYIASIVAGRKRTQRELAEITRTTETTIRTRYKELIGSIWLVMSM